MMVVIVSFVNVLLWDMVEKTIIRDNVMIGYNAYIASGIHNGNNVKIGAICVVVENIPDNALWYYKSQELY